jgi:hypothetical protein
MFKKVIISQDIPSDCNAQPHDVKWQGFRLID